jgi:hypothetical protein
MLSLVRLVRQPPARPIPRLWLVFFSECGGAWWTRALRPGWRHVCAAAWFDDQERWVVFDPSRYGIVVQVFRPEQFDLDGLLRSSTAVLRVGARFDRLNMPPWFFCVGAVKALLGIRSRALVPLGLYRDLLARGAEIVEVPESDGRAIQAATAAADPAGRPCGQSCA